MFIYGAGMAGLLAGNMLRRFNPIIHEAQDSLPNNHAALLRFRTDAASKATGIPFKSVNVNKLIKFGGDIYDRPNLKFTNMYSQKVSGKIMGRSISNLESVERYIAPPDFISQMASGLNINYGSALSGDNMDHDNPIISTIPMNIMMDIVDWPDKPEFNYKTIWSMWGKINKPVTDVYQTIYYPDPTRDFYRISITGDIIIIESLIEPTENLFQNIIDGELYYSFGICGKIDVVDVEIKEQKYGKLLPINEKIRKEFIMYLTDKYNIYSLGRFATWRQILLDDVVKDVEKIEKMVECRDDYNRKLLKME